VFVDQATITVRGGNGGNGMVAFRREKYVPKGGPAGGDGGAGGDVVLVVSADCRTLSNFRYQKLYVGENGQPGRSKNQHGAVGSHRRIAVPCGTLVYEGDKVFADLVTLGQELVVAKGGRGGRGNARFATAVNPAPHIVEKGEPGEERSLRLELKLVADVGLIGYPNAGKSTLLAALSSAKPKIGNYQFTTLAPQLGVVEGPDGESFVLADMPGLIEGAHQGTGLGHQFLRHISRAKLLVHVVDVADLTGDPYECLRNVQEELTLYDPALQDRVQLVVANKIDLASTETIEKFKEKLKKNVQVIAVSALLRQGLKPLVYTICNLLANVEPIQDMQETEEVLYSVRKEQDELKLTVQNGVYVVESKRLHRLVRMTDFTHYENQVRFAVKLKRMGVEGRLRANGAKNGDTVRIGSFEFQLQ
jgi:GTP-binding protein